MEVIIERFEYMPCELKIFTINGKKANKNDFGEISTHGKSDEDFCECVDMYFESNPPMEKVLNKYNITEEEYYNICNKLEDELYVGDCEWCV